MPSRGRDAPAARQSCELSSGSLRSSSHVPHSLPQRGQPAPFSLPHHATAACHPFARHRHNPPPSCAQCAWCWRRGEAAGRAASTAQPRRRAPELGGWTSGHHRASPGVPRAPRGFPGGPHSLQSTAGTEPGSNVPEEFLTRGPNLVRDNLIFNVSLNYVN